MTTSRQPMIQTRVAFSPGDPIFDELAQMEGNSKAIRAKIYTFILLGFEQYKQLKSGMISPAATATNLESTILRSANEKASMMRNKIRSSSSADIEHLPPENPVQPDDNFDVSFIVAD